MDNLRALCLSLLAIVASLLTGANGAPATAQDARRGFLFAVYGDARPIIPVFRWGLLAEAKRVDHLGPFVCFRNV